MKRCSGCLFFKPTSEFYSNKTSKNGFTTQCKECLNARCLCECGKEILKHDMSKHVKRAIHFKHLNFKNDHPELFKDGKPTGK